MSDDIRFDPTINSRFENVLPISNYTKRIDSLIDDSVTSEIGRRRMPRYVSALNKPALQKSDDICITLKIYSKANLPLKNTIQFWNFFREYYANGIGLSNWRRLALLRLLRIIYIAV